MNGMDALIAMQNGRIVQEEISGPKYKIENGTVVRSIGEDDWTECNLGLNLWLKRCFLNPSYTLTFFEAMVEADKGHKVRNEAYEIPYHMKKGILYYGDGCVASIYRFEMESKWKIVTEESE